MEIPESLKYTDSHEWIADHGDGTVSVGITAVATEQLGERLRLLREARQLERPVDPDARRHHFIDELLDRGAAQGRQHLALLRLGAPQMARKEIQRPHGTPADLR